MPPTETEDVPIPEAVESPLPVLYREVLRDGPFFCIDASSSKEIEEEQSEKGEKERKLSLWG